MATHSSILAWRIPWTEEPGGLHSMGSQSRTQLSDFTFTETTKVMWNTDSYNEMGHMPTQGSYHSPATTDSSHRCRAGLYNCCVYWTVAIRGPLSWALCRHTRHIKEQHGQTPYPHRAFMQGNTEEAEADSIPGPPWGGTTGFNGAYWFNKIMTTVRSVLRCTPKKENLITCASRCHARVAEPIVTKCGTLKHGHNTEHTLDKPQSFQLHYFRVCQQVCDNVFY